MVASLFIHSFCQHLLSASYGPGRALATENTEVNLTDKKPCSIGDNGLLGFADKKNDINKLNIKYLVVTVLRKLKHRKD